jgi:hypothetical protein
MDVVEGSSNDEALTSEKLAISRLIVIDILKQQLSRLSMWLIIAGP